MPVAVNVSLLPAVTNWELAVNEPISGLATEMLAVSP
jgi:hypothetical protein